MTKRLGIGIVGSGFNAKFHLLGFVGVRDADVLGVWSPNQNNAAETAGIAKKLGVGAAKAYPSIAAMVEDPAIDAIWLSGPNFARIENVEEIVSTIERGKGSLLGIACEKPLARNVSEAKKVLDLVNKVGLPHGYLENQVFAPQVEVGRNLLWARGAKLTGRPYLARAAEEHSGPHGPWFWQGALQGGGVLNDMMCHSGAAPPHRSEQGQVVGSPVTHHGPHRQSQVEQARLQQEAVGDDGERRELRQGAVGRLRERGDRVRDR